MYCSGWEVGGAKWKISVLYWPVVTGSAVKPDGDGRGPGRKRVEEGEGLEKENMGKQAIISAKILLHSIYIFIV